MRSAVARIQFATTVIKMQMQITYPIILHYELYLLQTLVSKDVIFLEGGVLFLEKMDEQDC